MDAFRRRIIECVRDRPVLWDPRNPNYKDKELRNRLWTEIVQQVPLPPGVVANHKNTWDHLTRGFANALRRRKRRTFSGVEYDVKWKFENDMMFLMPAKLLRTPRSFRPNSASRELDAYSDDEDNSVHSQTEVGALDGLDLIVHTKEEVDDDGLVDSEYIEVGHGSLGINNIDASNMNNLTSLRDIHKMRKRKRYEIMDDDGEEEDTATATGINNIIIDNCNVKERMRTKCRSQVGRAMKTVDESPRLGFFLSLMPALESLDDDRFMEFQMDVLHALKKQRQLSQLPTKTASGAISCDEEHHPGTAGDGPDS